VCTVLSLQSADAGQPEVKALANPFLSEARSSQHYVCSVLLLEPLQGNGLLSGCVRHSTAMRRQQRSLGGALGGEFAKEAHQSRLIRVRQRWRPDVQVSRQHAKHCCADNAVYERISDP